MPVMDNLRRLTRVRISAEGLGVRVGQIADIGTPQEFDLRPEYGASRVAVISRADDTCFVALEIAGEWVDFLGRKLTLEVIGQYEWPSPQPN